jgi:hypothetical protein
MAELPDSLKWRYSPAALKKLRESPAIKTFPPPRAGFTLPKDNGITRRKRRVFGRARRLKVNEEFLVSPFD